MKCSKTSWYTAVLTLDLRKHSGPTPADDMAPQTITDCGNFTLDLKQRGFCASPLFLQTLGPWFPKEMQNLLSSENITLDHSAAVQSFLSLAQTRRFWHCLLFKSGLTPVVVKVHRSSTWVKVQIRILKYYSSKSKSTAFSILLEWKYKSTQFFMYLSKKVLIDRFILQFYIDYFI